MTIYTRGLLGLLSLAVTLPALSGQTSITLSASPNPAILGSTVLLKAAVAPSIATGRVTFYDGVEILGSRPITAGTATLDTALLPAGSRKLRAYYAGDGTTAAGSSNTVTQTVNALPSSGSFVQDGRLPYSSSVVVADFDNRFGIEIALVLKDSSGLRLYKYNQSQLDLVYSADPGGQPLLLAAADFDNDGNADLLMSDVGTSKLTILPGLGNGKLGSALNVNLPRARVAAVADFNGDGNADLVTANLIGVTVTPGNGNGTFRSPVTFPSASTADVGADRVWVGDFNGDGKADVAAIRNPITGIRILLGNGDGTLQPPIGVPTAMNVADLAIADFNQDGKADLAYTSNEGLSVALGQGNGSFLPPAVSSLVIASPLVAADFTGDGKMDVAATASNGIGLALLAGNGKGTFQLAARIPSYWWSPLLAADFNWDGKTDLMANSAISLAGARTMRITRGALQSTPVGTAFPEPLEVTIQDDGLPVSGALVEFHAFTTRSTAVLSSAQATTDLSGVARVTATADQRPGSYRVSAYWRELQLEVHFELTNISGPLELTIRGGAPQSAPVGEAFAWPLKAKLTDETGNPVPGFTVSFAAPATGATATLSGASAVTDSDGIAMVTATAGSATGTYSVTARAGTAALPFSLSNRLRPSVRLSVAPQPSVLGAPVTMTASVTPSTATGRMTFYDGVTVLGTRTVSAGAASFSTTLLPAGRRKLSAYYSGDTTYAGGNVGVEHEVRAAAAGGFHVGSPLSLGPTVLQMKVAELNGDGKADLVISEKTATGEGQLAILLGKGDGGFSSPVRYALGPFAESLAIADFNLDGYNDVVAGYGYKQADGFAAILFGNSDGTLQRKVYIFGPNAPIVVADFNRDGAPDLVGQWGPTIALGYGDGTFQTPVFQSSMLGEFHWEVDDFNGDGNADVISGANSVQILFGNGDGSMRSWWSQIADAITETSPLPLAKADFNGDGFTDIVPQIGNERWLLLGRGNGTFQPPVRYTARGRAVASDFNGDGLTDLAVVSDSTVTFLRGNGDGTLEVERSYPTGAPTADVVVGDFDGDGRADLAVASDVATGASIRILSAAPGATLTVTGGSPQSTAASTPFAVALQVTVMKDSGPVQGATVAFLAPAGGASAVLSGTEAVTNAAGAARVTAVANGTAGSYTVTASYEGETVSFSLTNTTVGSIGVKQGSPQTALIGGRFLVALQVVVKHSSGLPGKGEVVTFTAPASGASAVVSGPAIADDNGVATAKATANAITGSYVVVASSGGRSVSFSLTNTAIGNVRIAGTLQTVVGSAFPTPLEITVQDTAGNLVPDLYVSFAAPATGASAYFPGATSTDSAGVARITARANGVAGSYTVQANFDKTPGSPSFAFTLVNLPVNTTNLALGKPATQSSTLAGYTTAGPAGAVDGNQDGNFFNGSVTHTNAENNAWWQVDLGSVTAIQEITIWNRTDCCGDRLGDYWVFASRVPFLASDSPATLQHRTDLLAFHQTGARLSTVLTTNFEARYVRIQLAGTNALSLAEVEVRGPAIPATANLALGKTATQSCTLAGYATADASRAVDGNREGNFFSGSVTHTNTENLAWWQVDLGSPATIQEITIWNRTDCCGSRLSNYWVFVSKNPFSPSEGPVDLQQRGDTLAIYQTPAPGPFTTLAANFEGRYVRVQLFGKDALSLAEVEVRGTPTTPASANLAAGRLASQSSTLSAYATAGAASAVDGNRDGNFFSGSVTHTNAENNAWWQVDLGSSAIIDSIVIWSRTDCCANRLRSYWVLVSDTPFRPGEDLGSWLSRGDVFSSPQAGGISSPSTTILLNGRRGRYVRVQMTGGEPLSLAEVEVMGIPGMPATNIAAGKAATQSSTLAGYGSAAASSAVDGETKGGFFGGSVTHTNSEPNAWWQVDLGASFGISSVVIWNRVDCCSDRLSDYWIFVSDTPFSGGETPATLQGRAGTFSTHQVGAPSPSATIPLAAQGRYVRVQLSGTNALSLAEVLVMGK